MRILVASLLTFFATINCIANEIPMLPGNGHQVITSRHTFPRTFDIDFSLLQDGSYGMVVDVSFYQKCCAPFHRVTGVFVPSYGKLVRNGDQIFWSFDGSLKLLATKYALFNNPKWLTPTGVLDVKIKPQSSRNFLVTVFLRSKILSGLARANTASEILRNADGSVRIMNQYDALKSCPRGTHLPTIRELAREAQSKGASGILEVNPSHPNETPVGYVKISAINSDGKADRFYFNWSGYETPAGDLGKSWVWSSSITADRTDDAYTISGYYGGIVDSRRDDSNYQFAVRCFAN